MGIMGQRLVPTWTSLKIFWLLLESMLVPSGTTALEIVRTTSINTILGHIAQL